MRPGEIEEVAKAFGHAVRLAREAGFDAVEVHAGHGYLLSQFLSPYTNHRKDMYGGSLENRMRFMKMAMNEVMEAAGSDMAVLVKTNMRDGFKGGIELDEGLEIARELERCGAHALVLERRVRKPCTHVCHAGADAHQDADLLYGYSVAEGRGQATPGV